MKKTRELHSLKTPKGLWQEISINIIGLLLKSNGKDTIVVIVDRFMKMVQLKATMTNISLEEIAKIYHDEIWKLYGVPRTILSDREPQFTLKFIKDLIKALGTCHIQVHLSGKLHPHSDATSKPYKPAFHGSHLSHNTSYGGAATLRIFRLPWRRYSYSTQSSMTELLLSVSQH